jgi:hypothetical protein
VSELHPLARAVEHPSSAKGTLARWRIVTGLVLAPAAYALLVISGYTIAANECSAGAHPSVTLRLVDFVAIAAIATGLLISLINFRTTRTEAGGGHSATQDIGEGRTRFLAYAGLCASGIFGLAVLIHLTTIFVLDRCLGFPALP